MLSLFTASGGYVHREYNYQDSQAESVHRRTQSCEPVYNRGEQHRLHQQTRYLKISKCIMRTILGEMTDDDDDLTSDIIRAA